MLYHSLEEICALADKEKKPFWEIVADDTCTELSISLEEALARMQETYQVMRESDRNYDLKKKSGGRMAGGDGQKIADFCGKGRNLSGAFIGKVMERAVKMAETNACMGRIVAAPTAGSCGVLPAVLLTYEELEMREKEENGSSRTDVEDQAARADAGAKTDAGGRESEESRENLLAEALFTAAGIGQIIAEKASLAGASGGCQAEIGSASGMAAAALTFLRGGTNLQCCDAAAIALKSLMGLVCDPVAGLVEVPCVKRNVAGAVNAVTASDMVMAGVRSVIPADEVIEAMGEVGRDMSQKFRETSEGGLAATPTGKRLAEEIIRREQGK
ncbi:MAG: L-serine ammonia-lyase, iron-sulfur-dependent, subunit alpha [Eubacterium sp.]|nr:L-serine ammonia-lyase, iron-sulfur-dependent, subunit alpha [Eubacterium sp.]